MTVKRTIVLNAFLTFSYVLLGALAFGPENIGVATVAAAVVAGVRAAVGYVLDARGATLPMDRV